MRLVSIMIAATFTLAACDSTFGTRATQAAAKRVVNQVIEDKAPGD